jgi:hypothetical protein
MDIYIIIFITLIASLIVSASQILFKRGVSGKRFSPRNIIPTILRSRLMLIGALGYFISLVIYLYALKAAPLSVVYPIFASSFIFVTIFSAAFLGDAYRRGGRPAYS